jgi:rRNA maturation protein Nop10
MQAVPVGHAPSAIYLEVAFASRGGGVAYTVGVGERVYVVFNGHRGISYESTGPVELSPDGSHYAYRALANEKWRLVLDGKEGVPFDSIMEPKFSPDGRHLAYRALRGERWHLVVDATVNSGTAMRYRLHEFSGDSAHIAYLETVDEATGTARLLVSDLSLEKERTVESSVTDMALSADRTSAAAIARGDAGTQRVIQFAFARPEVVARGAEYAKIHKLAFASGSSALAFVGERQGRLYGVYNGQEEILPGGATADVPVVNGARGVVGVLLSVPEGVYLYEMFRNSGRVGSLYDEAEWLSYSADGAYSAFAARKGQTWCVVVNGEDGPRFDRVVTPRFSPDGKHLVYRARKDGKRFVVVAEASGAVLREHPSYEQVFDAQFTPDSKAVAYGVKDGKQLAWKVEGL